MLNKLWNWGCQRGESRAATQHNTDHLIMQMQVSDTNLGWQVRPGNFSLELQANGHGMRTAMIRISRRDGTRRQAHSTLVLGVVNLITRQANRNSYSPNSAVCIIFYRTRTERRRGTC